MGTLKYLLDTHTLLWAVRGDAKLSDTVRNTLMYTSDQVFISAVSAYEIMYKYKIGKLQGFEDVAGNYFDVLKEFGADELPVTTHHAHYAGELDWEHRDPFDRLLVAQAHVDNLILITDDPYIKSFQSVVTLW